MELKYSLLTKAATDDASQSILVYGSRFDQVDRDGELVTREAFEHEDSLKEYLAHPVLCVGHSHSGLVVGRAKKVEVTSAGLKMRVSFLDTPSGKECYTICRDGSGDLGTFSIGFIGIESEYRSTDDLHKRGVDVTLANGPRVRCWTHVKLLKVSLVAVPSNIGCTVVGRALKDGRVKSFKLAGSGSEIITITDPPKSYSLGELTPMIERASAQTVAISRMVDELIERTKRLTAENARLKREKNPKAKMSAEDVKRFLSSEEFADLVKIEIAKKIGRVF